jgi:CheY-like chemotaxis protein
MARILIFEGTNERFIPLRNSLQDHHELHIVHDITDSTRSLHEEGSEIDLIVSSVYEDATDLFEFIETVKQDPLLCRIPVLCFSRERSSRATALDANVEHAALLFGADKYLSMDSFCGAKAYTDSCKACPWLGELCGYALLRRAVEDMILESKFKRDEQCECPNLSLV